MSDVPVEVSVEETKKLCDAGEVVLIDCREPNEYEVAAIEGSILMPMSDWAQQSEKLEDYKGKSIIVHCHHGGRSLRVTQWLRQNGFPDTRNMTGGIDAWSTEIDESVPRY